MSAAQPKASEPSMEEILASIRRIIADEPHKAAAAPEAAASPSAAQKPAPAADDDDDEVMELTPKPKSVESKAQEARAPEPRVKAPEPHFITDDPVDNDLSFADPSPPKQKSQDDIDALMSFDPPAEDARAPEPVPLVVAPPAAPAQAVQAMLQQVAPPATPAERLISAETDKAASTAFSSLATTILSKNARTLEDLMQDMMRPMIKSWLDDNLPTVVERLVKAEIERVSRGGR
jgi:uncharacterized protein